MTYVLDFRAASVGGAVLPGRIVEGSLAQLQRASDITFLIHGFNVDRPTGLADLKRFAARLSGVAHHALVITLWPGDHWAGAFSYSFEGRDADDTSLELAKFIYTHLGKRPRISFATHSLGARVALQAIKLLVPYGFSFQQAVLMAAAVDDFSLGYPRDYRDGLRGTRRVSVLASRRDQVLRLAYPAGDLFQSWLYFADDRWGQALGYHGPRVRDGNNTPANVLHAQIPDYRNAGHSDYLPDPTATRNQQSSARFCSEALAGHPVPVYP